MTYVIGIELVTPALRQRHAEILRDTTHAIITHRTDNNGDHEVVIVQAQRATPDGTPLAGSGRPLEQICRNLARQIGAQLGEATAL